MSDRRSVEIIVLGTPEGVSPESISDWVHRGAVASAGNVPVAVLAAAASARSGIDLSAIEARVREELNTIRALGCRHHLCLCLCERGLCAAREGVEAASVCAPAAAEEAAADAPAATTATVAVPLLGCFAHSALIIIHLLIPTNAVAVFVSIVAAFAARSDLFIGAAGVAALTIHHSSLFRCSTVSSVQQLLLIPPIHRRSRGCSIRFIGTAIVAALTDASLQPGWLL